MRDEFESRFYSVGSRISLGLGGVVGPVVWLSDRFTNGEPVVEQYGYLDAGLELVFGTAIAVLAGAFFGWGVFLMLAITVGFGYAVLIIALELVRRVSTWLLERLSPSDR
jgi:hypothetical protein